jgi:L-fucono-1,5-lactonase
MNLELNIKSISRACVVLFFGPLVACGAGQSTTKAGDTPVKPASAEAPAAAETKAAGPIMDTHIHMWQVTRPGGVVWPTPKFKLIYRDITPAEYKEVAKKNGIVATGIVEASPKVDDNDKILDLVKGDDFFKFLVGQLEIGSPSFSKDLDRLAKDSRFVGIRGFLWSPKLTLDAKQVASLKELEKKGMSLDIISRGDLNPKDKVVAIAEAAPKLRIIIDHLGGAKGETPDPKWVESMQKLAKHENVYIKFSSFFDMFNPAASEEEPWTSPAAVASYKAHFDVLYKAFGEDRLVWGSNWPVVELGGGISKEIAIAEEYLKPYGQEVRDKIMYKNAQKFYSRH